MSLIYSQDSNYRRLNEPTETPESLFFLLSAMGRTLPVRSVQSKRRPPATRCAIRESDSTKTPRLFPNRKILDLSTVALVRQMEQLSIIFYGASDISPYMLTSWGLFFFFLSKRLALGSNAFNKGKFTIKVDRDGGWNFSPYK